MKLTPLFHPFLFFLATILFLYPQSAVIASPEQIVRPLLVVWLLLFILAWPAFWLARDWHGAALLLTIFVLGVCSTRLFFIAAGTVSLVVLILWFIVARIRKRRMGIAHVNNLLTLVSITLVVILTIPLMRRWTALPASYTGHVPVLPVSLTSTDSRPDIYYIVLDGYARADILGELYNYDNSEFIRFLQSRNFFVPVASHSNYPKTVLSVTSTLNMDYMDALSPGLQDQPFWWLTAPLMDHSRVRESLEQLDYQTVSITTDWSITDNPTVDVYFSPKSVILSDFESFLLATTPLGFIKPILSKFVFVPSFRSHYDLILYNFKILAQIPALPGPKFIFAHIVAPHPPFVFNPQGNFIEPAYPFSFNDANDYPFSDDTYRDGYIGQVQFVNGQLETLIDAILKDSAAPPIIILQADHGPGMLTDFRSSGNTCLKERFSAFAAYHLPGVKSADIPEDITPVNLFRIVFNEYFGTDLHLLENKNYFSAEDIKIFRLEDVTSRVDTCFVP